MIIAGIVIVLVIVFYLLAIRPRTEKRRYARSRLVRRRGEHSEHCGCKEHRVK